MKWESAGKIHVYFGQQMTNNFKKGVLSIFLLPILVKLKGIIENYSQGSMKGQRD